MNSVTDPAKLKDQVEHCHTIIADLGKIQSKLNKAPACWHRHGEEATCIRLESDDPYRGWNQYRQERMCPPCAAYWAVSVVVNHLHDSIRRDEGVRIEQERKARAT